MYFTFKSVQEGPEERLQQTPEQAGLFLTFLQVVILTVPLLVTLQRAMCFSNQVRRLL
jgi:hypothetical protein